MERLKILSEIERKLEYHPGDAPWSCIECYHNRPCVELEILMAAKTYLENPRNRKKISKR